MRKCIILIEDPANAIKILSSMQYGIWYSQLTGRELNIAFSDYKKLKEFLKADYVSLFFGNRENLYNDEYIVDTDLFTTNPKVHIYESNVPLELEDEDVYINFNSTDCQDYKEEIIKEYISIDEEVIEKIKAAYDNIDFNNHIVSIYIDKPNDIEDLNKLLKLIKTVMKQYTGMQDIWFILLSNDMEWCKNIFKKFNFDYIDKEIEGYSKEITDLIILTMCTDNLLGTNMLSWWSAYLNNHEDKQVFYSYPWYPYVNMINDTFNNWIKIKQQEKYNIALCVLADVDNVHVHEWIQYYKKMGISHIYIYDTLEKMGMPSKILHYYIEKNYVSVFNTKGLKVYTSCYTDCYTKFGSLYDWIGFVTMEDFIITDKPLNKILYDEKFNDYAAIKVARQEYISMDDDEEEEDIGDNEFDISKYTIKISSKYNKKYAMFLRTKIQGVIICENTVIFNTKDKVCYIDGSPDNSPKHICKEMYCKYIR